MGDAGSSSRRLTDEVISIDRRTMMRQVKKIHPKCFEPTLPNLAMTLSRKQGLSRAMTTTNPLEKLNGVLQGRPSVPKPTRPRSGWLASFHPTDPGCSPVAIGEFPDAVSAWDGSKDPDRPASLDLL
jgi:hypothetical protein